MSFWELLGEDEHDLMEKEEEQAEKQAEQRYLQEGRDLLGDEEAVTNMYLPDETPQKISITDITSA